MVARAPADLSARNFSVVEVLGLAGARLLDRDGPLCIRRRARLSYMERSPHTVFDDHRRPRRDAAEVGRFGTRAACGEGINPEQSFGVEESSKTMMSTHCSLLIGGVRSRTTPMTSAFVSASIFGAGLILGYALRAWRVQRRTVNSSRGPSRRTSQPAPTSTFGHARRAF